MKKSIKKLIKDNNIELKADIKKIKKQYKKALKALDTKYSKQIENIKGEANKNIAGQDIQEKLTENTDKLEVIEKDLELQNHTDNSIVTEVKKKSNKKTKTEK